MFPGVCVCVCVHVTGMLRLCHLEILALREPEKLNSRTLFQQKLFSVIQKKIHAEKFRLINNPSNSVQSNLAPKFWGRQS